MDVREFLKELSFSFQLKKKPEDLDRFFESYVNDILYIVNQHKGYSCDYEKLLTLVRIKHAYNTFPLISKIVEEIPNALVENEAEEYKECVDEGDLIVIKLPNGYTYQFTICNIGNKSLKDLKAEFHRKFGNCQVTQYPKGTVIIGDKVYLPD